MSTSFDSPVASEYRCLILRVINMENLTTKHCLPCEGGTPPLDKNKVQNYLQQFPNWELTTDGKKISKNFSFKNFYHTMSFVNAIAYMANQENHHPDLEVGYNYCKVHYTTHAIDGLSENDFICAAKVDALLVQKDKPTTCAINK